ncbi:FxsA family protein [Rhizobium oryzicola]|uniref:FxsA family protein n=1 Tax=Rhizobium oryzicola TaxID=1232668 RepID=A0ABT8T1U8_9HYPH|nr:FxsA family protein [Rhizobium oryzicola]MDO1584724.1 FxsA family protein [Rhizobium oryzicola]
MRLFLFPLILFGLPLAEIAGFVIVGRAVGVWGTLGLVLLSVLVGSLLLRSQGVAVLRQINDEGRQGRVPAKAIVDGAMMVLGSILLIIPGFLTDILGLLLFVPPVRDAIWRMIGERAVVRTSSYRSSSDGETRSTTIDLNADDYRREQKGPSPWSTKRLDDER